MGHNARARCIGQTQSEGRRHADVAYILQSQVSWEYSNTHPKIRWTTSFAESLFLAETTGDDRIGHKDLTHGLKELC